MSIFDERYNRLSEIKKKRAESAQTQTPQPVSAGSPFDGYKITSRPGARSAPTAGASTNHRGLDRAMPKGTALRLPIDVTYYRSGSDKARGKWIEFKDAGGNILHYQHLDSYGIFKPGQSVPAGSQIAVSGASGIGTGAHLHEEYWSPDGQNITESYWGANAKGAKSGAAPVEYKKAGGNIFNVGTNALAREGKSALSGSYENLSRFEKVQMLKNRRKERERYNDTIRKYSSPLGSRRGQRGNKVGAALGEKLDDWVGNENQKAEDYRRRMSDTAASSEARLSDENFMQAAIDGYQNARGKAEGWGNRNKTNPRQSPYARGQRRTKEDKLSLAEYMTDTEVLTYSGLLNTEGEKKAEEYLVSIREKLRKRAYEHKQYPEKFADAAKVIYNNPYGLPEGYYQKRSVFDDVKMPGTLEKAEKGAKKGGYIGSVVKSTAAGLGSVTAFTQTAGQAIKNRITGEYEPVDIYSPMFDRAREQQVIQRAATERDAPWIRFLKEAGFSIAGSLANAAVGGPVGEGASLALMGANAAGSSALDSSERGLTPAQAATLGGVNGALEAATEMIPVKNIFAAFKSKRAGVELAKSVLHAGFENAGQEAINTLAGNIADEMVAGDKSELMENAREYAKVLQQEKGLSNEKAISEGIKKAAFNAYIYDPLYSAASGAFSGAVQTGASAVAGRAAADVSDTVRAYSAGQNAGAAIDKLGYKVELTDNAELDGKVDKKKGIVYFNPEGADFKQTVKHEISHMVENNEKYTEFKSFVKEEMPEAYKAAERRVVDRLARVNEWREQRGLKKYKTDAETIEAETFAELAEVLKSDRLIRRFALGDDMPRTMRVIEFARDAGARLSEKLGTDNGWNTAARKWAAALTEVRKSESGTAQTEQRYKIAYTEENTPVVVVEEDILKGVPKEDWAKKAREALRQFSGGIRVGGRVVNVNKNTGREYTNSRYSGNLAKNDAGKYADKMRAANNADEIVKGARDYVDEDLKHARKDGIKQFARGNVLMEIGGRKYSAEVVIGTNSENKQVLYDVVGVKNAEFTKKTAARVDGQSDNRTPIRTIAADTDSISQKGDAVNTSIRESNTNDTNERYKIRENEKGKYVQAERQVITGKDPSKWGGQVTNYINDQIRKGKDVQVIAADGDVLTITRDTAGKARFRNYVTNTDGTKRPMTDSEYAVKLRAETHIDEVSAVSKRGAETTPDRKKHKFAKDGFNYRTAYFKDFDGKYYRLTISVGKNGEALTVYNVGKQKQIPQATQRSDVPKNTERESVYTDSISQKSDAVNSSIRESNENDTNERYKIRDTEITEEDVKAVQSVGRKSVNSFSGDDVKATEGFARKYYHEMGTKSPFFRAWFGDWRAADKSPVRIANRRDAARGVVKNADTGWNVQVSGKVFNETKGHKAPNNTKAVAYLDYINSIVENAVLLDSSAIPSGKTKSSNSAMMHSLYAIADMGSGRELIKLYVEELNDVNSDGTIKRAYQLQNINKIPLESNRFSNNRLASSDQRNTYTVAQLFDIVKSSDKNFAPKSTSKVVNEDGTPKVVYHGTGERFNVFDITRSRSYDETLNYDLPGFYFSESTDESGSYGENVGAYYIDIKKPYTGDTYALAKRLGSYRKAYDYLVSQGYDGVIVDDLGEGYNEYIVFGNTQIKSATDNVGTFDGGNPDVRYKLKDVDRIRSSTDYIRREIKKLEWDNKKLRQKLGKTEAEEQSTDSGERQWYESYDEYLEHRYDALLKENKILHGEYDGKYFNSYSDWLAFRIDRVEEENKKLKQTRQTLERMANIAGEVHVDVMKISDYAAEVKKETSSLLPRREIAARLEKIYSDIAKSGAEDDGSGAYRELFDLANDILSASDVVDRSMYERYADLREFLRNTPISLSKTDRADIPDWSDFVKRNRGRIRISEKGTGVDSIYEQLAAEYPEFFAESGYTHPADRLKHIEKVRDSLDPVYNNQRHTDDEAAILAQSMFSHYFSEENAPLEHQTLLELIRGRLQKDVASELEEKYKKEIERYKDRLEYYRFLDRNVAKRAKAAGGKDAAPEYIDRDVTDEYLYKYVKNIKFGNGFKEARVLRRKYADREHIVLDFDRPSVVSAEDRKTWQYKASDAPEYADIIDRVKRRTKIEQNQYNGAAKEGTLAYDKHNIWRNMRKFFGDRDYAKIKELILDPLDDSKRQFEYIQEFYTNVLYDKVVRELGIKEGSRLSALVQMYGEGVLLEEDIKTFGAENMEKIKKADRIFRGAYDGLLDTMNETRKKIYPHAQEKVKKIEEQLKEIRQEMFLIEAGYTSGDFSELSANQWESLRNIEIRRESANELIYRAKEAAKERIASLDEAIERTEAELFKLGNRMDTQKYQDIIARRDRLVVRKNEIMQLTEAKVDKLTGMAKKLTEKFDENSSVFKEKLLKRLVELNQREGELIGLLGTDEITYGRMIERRRDYYHHFEELCDAVPEFIGYMKVHANDKLSTADKIKGYINSRGIRHNHNIDNRLAGKSENTKPKAKWQSFAQRREGGNAAKYDAVGGFKRYISAAAYTAAIDPNISIFRALADDLAKPIDGKPSDSNMNGFVDYLQEYANDLAGKSNKYGDRLIARSLGRNAWNRINRISSRTKNNQVVYNAACSWAQILNVPQAIAYMREHPVALTKSMADTLESFLPGKSEVKERYKYSSFLTERFSDYRTQFLPAHKRIPAKIANFMLGALDEVGTKYIWNAAYRSAIIEGNKAPIRYADDVTRRMVAGRGIGELPYYQKSKFIGMLIPFTLESGNVIDVYDDMRRDRRQKHDVDNKRGLSRAAAAVGASVDYGLDMLVLFVANHFFNWVMTKLRGTDGGLFDPIADVQKGIKNNYGVLRTAGLIAGDFVGSFPSGSFLAGMLPEYGVELPWGFNLPSRSDIFGDSDPTRFGGGGVLKSAIKDPVHMLILPTGGAQVRKMEKVIYASLNGAVRTRSGKVKYELTDKSYFNIIRGLLYGTSALTESAEYYDKKEVNLHDTPDGFEYKHKSRDVTVGTEKIKLEEDELDRFERVRLARYKRLAEYDNKAFTLRNPYGTPKKEWSYERRVKYDGDVKRMLKVLNGLIDQESITQERAREIYKAYKNGEETKVRGVEFYAPTKIERVKKFADFTPVQKRNYRKQVLSDIKSGDMSLDDGRELLEKIDSKQWDFDAPVSEYITGDMKNLTAEEKKKIHSKLNSLATDFAKENWKERRDSWLNKWKGKGGVGR